MPAKQGGSLTAIWSRGRILSHTMTWRFLVPAFLVFLACTALHGADRPVIPAAMPQERYRPMIMRSPFSLGTPEADASAPSFAENLFVMGLAKLGDQDMVTISSRGNSDRLFTLIGRDDEFGGISLVGVEWSDEVGKSRVTLKKGSEVGVIQFNEAVIKSPIAVTPAPGSKPPIPRIRPSRRNIRDSGETGPTRRNTGIDRRVRRIRRPGDR